MTHLFYLDNLPFFKIYTGSKTIELRLNDEKRQSVKIGDTIIFTNREDERQLVSVRVTALHKFDDFEQLYSSLPLNKCGYAEDEIQSANPKDMEKYYSKKDIKKYGVIGIEFEKTDNRNIYPNGLVLEGGGLRAIYTSGVLDAFMENNIEFPYVIGVSAGTCNGVSFIGKNLQRMRDISIKYSSDERYMSVKSMFKNGEYLNSKWIFGELTYDLSPLDYDTYEAANTTMCVVATNAKTGKPEYFYPKDFRDNCEVLRASCALPIATKPVPLGKDVYYDGGLTDSIPLKRAFEDGCKKCVVILTQDKNYIKKPMGHQRIVKRTLRRYPLMAEGILVRHNMYNKQREFVFEQQKLGNAFVICPDRPLNAPTLEKDPQKLKEIYDIGYKQGLANIEKVKEFLK